jgi:hypothetical protein
MVEKKNEACTWQNMGCDGQPFWYIAECNGNVVNVQKLMKKQGHFVDTCIFCGKTVYWKKAEKRK